MDMRDYILSMGLPVKQFYNTAEACRVFGVTRCTIYRWSDSGRLPAVMIRGHRFFALDTVIAVLSGAEVR